MPTTTRSRIFQKPGAVAAISALLTAGLAWSALGPVSPASAADPVGSYSALQPAGDAPGDNTTSLAFLGGTLYAGGFSWANSVGNTDFISSWTPDSWHALGAGLNGTHGLSWVAALAVQGRKLFAAGPFDNAIGVPGTHHIAEWSGGAWHSMGSADSVATDGTVTALAAQDDTLYAAGQFTQIGGVSAPNIASWSGGAWHPMGSGLSIGVNPELAATNDTLYVAGDFTSAGGVADTMHIASWSGGAWHALGAGGGANSVFTSLAVRGSTLYAGGNLDLPGGTTAMQHLAAWSDGAWHEVGGGLDETVSTLAVDDRHGLIYAGGPFTNTANPADPVIARVWDEGISTWIPLNDGSGTSPFVFYQSPLVSAIAPRGADVFVAFGNIELNGGGRVVRWTWGAPTANLSRSSGLANSNVLVTGSNLIGVDSVRFGTTRATFTRTDTHRLTARVPRNLAPGIYPVSISAVGGTVSVGTYTVLPPTITITGSRGIGRDSRSVFVDGLTTNWAGRSVQVHVRLQGQSHYVVGATRTVSSRNTFAWERKATRKAYIYFEAGGVRSNRVVIPGR